MSQGRKIGMWVIGAGALAFVWAANSNPALQIALQSAFAACVGWVR